MNRLSPLIIRKTGRYAPAPHWAFQPPQVTAEQASELIEDLRLFATAFAGGLVFFGTFLG